MVGDIGKFGMVKFKGVFLLLLTFGLRAADFEQSWGHMQQVYTQFRRVQCHPDLVSPWWQERCADMARVLEGPYVPNIFSDGRIMFAAGIADGAYGRGENFQEIFLTKCLVPSAKNRIARCAEVPFGGFKSVSPVFKCGSNTLGHLFYLGRMLNTFPIKGDEIFCEFGGGYGSLARLIKQAVPGATLVLFDTPEYLALQYLYLSCAFPAVKIIPHKTAPTSFERGCIHLIPVGLMRDTELNTDIFVSTFALTEAPQCVQDIVMRKNFFGASWCYIAGQLDDWHTFTMSPELFDTLQQRFSVHFTNVYHRYNEEDNSSHSYEFVGMRS